MLGLTVRHVVQAVIGFLVASAGAWCASRALATPPYDHTTLYIGAAIFLLGGVIFPDSGVLVALQSLWGYVRELRGGKTDG